MISHLKRGDVTDMSMRFPHSIIMKDPRKRNYVVVYQIACTCAVWPSMQKAYQSVADALNVEMLCDPLDEEKERIFDGEQEAYESRHFH